MITRKKFFKLIGFECLYMLIITLVAGGATWVQTLFNRYVDSYSGVIFAGNIYQYNGWMYMMGTGIYFVFAYFLYRRFRVWFAVIAELHTILKVMAWVVILVWGVIMCITEFCVLFISVLGLSNDLGPEMWMLFTTIGWPLVTVFFWCVLFIKKAKK